MNSAAGVLSDGAIGRMARQGHLVAAMPLTDKQIQPASLDLRLGTRAWRVRASFLPGRDVMVERRLANFLLHEIDLSDGAILETGCVYIAELQEELRLPPDVEASANPKSSTGRLDVFTRVIADGATSFDRVPAGYRGPLYAEICPKTFPILVRRGSTLSQIRFRTGSAVLSPAEIASLHAEDPLTNRSDAVSDGAVALTVDLAGFDGGHVGYRAKRHTGLIDVDARGRYPVRDFWEPVTAAGDGTLVLDPNEFYILASKDVLRVPPGYAAEMLPFDAAVGEFRAHYAGFFDPGFGHRSAGGEGSRAVLEVRASSVPFAIEDGQVVAKLVYERMAERPDRLYGSARNSNYQSQKLALGRVFAAP